MCGLSGEALTNLYKSPARCGAMDALLRGLNRVLAAAEQGGQIDTSYDFSAASALRDPEPLEAVYFDAPGSYDLSKVSEIKRTDTIRIRRGVRAVQMPYGFCLDQSRLSVVSTTLGTLSELVFPSSHFQYHWIGVSGQEFNKLRVTNMRGDPVCILRVGYVTNRSPESAGLVYVCSFNLHGELKQQFHSIRCMAYNLCWSFINRWDRLRIENTTEIRDRMRSLVRYLWDTWGRDECMYALDHEDVRLLRCLRRVGITQEFNSIERMVCFVCARVKRLELCCLFHDMMQPHRFHKRQDLQPDGSDDVPGPEPASERSDDFQTGGSAVEDGSGS